MNKNLIQKKIMALNKILKARSMIAMIIKRIKKLSKSLSNQKKKDYKNSMSKLKHQEYEKIWLHKKIYWQANEKIHW